MNQWKNIAVSGLVVRLQKKIENPKLYNIAVLIEIHKPRFLFLCSNQMDINILPYHILKLDWF